MSLSIPARFTKDSTIPDAGRLRILVCRVCGMPFAAPITFIAARLRDSQPVHCPGGHVYRENSKEDETADTFAINIGLAELNADLQARLDAADRELMILRQQTAAVELTEKEIDRRRNLLAAKAAPASLHRKVCIFCGKAFKQLPTHLLNIHKEEIARLSEADLQ